MMKYTIPKYIEPEAKKFMKVVLKHITGSEGMFNQVDTGALDIMADSFNTFIKCRDLLSREGFTFENIQGNTVAHPAVKIMNDAKNQYMNICKEFGFTIMSRKRISRDKDDSEPVLLDTLFKAGGYD